MKSRGRIWVLCGLFVSAHIFSDGQDYYGGGGGSWRRQPSNNKNNQSQEKDDDIVEPSGFLSVNFGFANPEGNFGQSLSQNSYNNSAAGIGYGNYADPGNVFHFSLGIPINHSNFGVAFMFGNYTNPYDINNYVNSLNNSPVGYNAYSNSPIAGYAAGDGQNVYTESSILGGLFATYPFGRLSIDGRLMIGALLSSLPEQNVYAEDIAGDELQYDVEPSNATSLAFDLGVGARFMVARLGSRKLCVMVNVDYLYSNVSYNTQQDIYAIPASGANAGNLITGPSPQISGSLPIQLLSVTFGVGYQL